MLFLSHALSATIAPGEFIWAARRGDIETVSAYIQNNGNVNAKDFKGQTALLHATIMGHFDIIKLLINTKAYLEAKDDQGRTALLYAINYAGMTEYNKIARLLIAAGSDVNTKDNNDKTPLMYAANVYDGSVIIDSLLQAGAEPNIQDKDGKTALFYAVENNKLHAVMSLVMYGGDAELKDANNQSAYKIALQNNCRIIVGFFQDTAKRIFDFDNKFVDKIRLLYPIKTLLHDNHIVDEENECNYFMILFGNRKNYKILSYLFRACQPTKKYDVLVGFIKKCDFSRGQMTLYKKRGFPLLKDEYLMKNNLISFDCFFDFKISYDYRFYV